MIMESSLIEVLQYNTSQCWPNEGFGPLVDVTPCPGGSGRDGFDFTLQFEQSIMSIGPSVLFLLAVPLRWLQLQRQSRKTNGGEILGQGKVVSLSIDYLSSIAVTKLSVRVASQFMASYSLACLFCGQQLPTDRMESLDKLLLLLVLWVFLMLLHFSC